MKKLPFVVFMSMATFAYTFDAGTYSSDIGINLGTKAGPGLVFSLRYFVVQDIAVEVHVGGFLTSAGLGVDLSYFPVHRFPNPYLLTGVSFLTFGGGDGVDNIVRKTTAIMAFALVGATTNPLHLPSSSLNQGKATTGAACLFLEGGVARCIHSVTKIDGAVEEEGDALFDKKWSFSNIVFGLRAYSKW